MCSKALWLALEHGKHLEFHSIVIPWHYARRSLEALSLWSLLLSYAEMRRRWQHASWAWKHISLSPSARWDSAVADNFIAASEDLAKLYWDARWQRTAVICSTALRTEYTYLSQPVVLTLDPMFLCWVFLPESLKTIGLDCFQHLCMLWLKDTPSLRIELPGHTIKEEPHMGNWFFSFCPQMEPAWES